MMASDFYESNLQKQRDCLIAETYKSEVILSTVISIKCRFDQVSFDQLSQYKIFSDRLTHKTTVC